MHYAASEEGLNAARSAANHFRRKRHKNVIYDCSISRQSQEAFDSIDAKTAVASDVTETDEGECDLGKPDQPTKSLTSDLL